MLWSVDNIQPICIVGAITTDDDDIDFFKNTTGNAQKTGSETRL